MTLSPTGGGRVILPGQRFPSVGERVMEKQVFYFSDSPVAALASGLSDPFAPRAVPRSKPPRALAGAPLVWLADGDKDAKALGALARRYPQLRVVYVLKANAKL